METVLILTMSIQSFVYDPRATASNERYLMVVIMNNDQFYIVFIYIYFLTIFM